MFYVISVIVCRSADQRNAYHNYILSNLLPTLQSPTDISTHIHLTGSVDGFFVWGGAAGIAKLATSFLFLKEVTQMGVFMYLCGDAGASSTELSERPKVPPSISGGKEEDIFAVMSGTSAGVPSRTKMPPRKVVVPTLSQLKILTSKCNVCEANDLLNKDESKMFLFALPNASTRRAPISRTVVAFLINSL